MSDEREENLRRALNQKGWHDLTVSGWKLIYRFLGVPLEVLEETQRESYQEVKTNIEKALNHNQKE